MPDKYLVYDSARHMPGRHMTLDIICLVYAWHMPGIWHLRDICEAYAKYMPGICLAYTWHMTLIHMPGICQAYTWHMTIILGPILADPSMCIRRHRWCSCGASSAVTDLEGQLEGHDWHARWLNVSRLLSSRSERASDHWKAHERHTASVQCATTRTGIGVSACSKANQQLSTYDYLNWF